MVNKHLEIILKEMCKRVGANYNDIDFKDKEWYTRHEWLEEEQEDFHKWLVDYLYNNTEARKEILRYPRKNKKLINKAVTWFLFDYGWKLKKGDEK